MEVRAGSRVRSKAGRDKGCDFIVMSVQGEYVFLADGDTRKVENPKKKKLKHIQASYDVAGDIADKLASGDMAQNHEVRKALAKILC